MKQTLEEAARQELISSYAIVHSGKFVYTTEAMLNMFKKGAEWQAKQSLWISVKETVPPTNKLVLVHHGGKYFVGYLSWTMCTYWWNRTEIDIESEPVDDEDYWMDKPELPKIN